MSNYILIDGTLYHHGIKGQKWGLRRWQNEDGSLTPAGREHYGYGQAKAAYKDAKKAYRKASREESKAYNKAYNYSSRHLISQNIKGSSHYKKSNDNWNNWMEKDKAKTKAKETLKKAKIDYKNSEEYKQAKDKAKKIAIAGAAVAATALATYGVYKVANLKNDAMKAYISDGKRTADAIFNFNSAANIKARESGVTGKMYYQMKNIYGDVIQTGSAKNFDSYQKMIADRNWTNTKKHAEDMANIRKEAQQFKEGSLINAYKYLKNRK